MLLGHSAAEMRAKMPFILEFAELEEYGDVPVRALSSGMVARLGFAIATDTNPDILILDEVLAVGDESFRNKSRRRIESMWHDHVTVLRCPTICSSSAMRAAGLFGWRRRIVRDGSPAEVVDAYLRSVDSSALERLARARARLTQ